ncbi:MAG: YajQ family cyclic di-GMP-binding protein [Candidatus Omnitrophica bacterium]|nr:YajQ family cyclic di-GMP-binding protein [Candidatus Omnitrophota bacterium]
MAKENSSFDIVAEANLQEVDNAVNQTKKELLQRYDFKGSKASIEYNRDEKKITLVGDNDFKLRALKDIFASKLAKRGVSIKLLIFKEQQTVFGGCIQQTADLVTGIPHEKAKEITAIIKKLGLKVQVRIEGEKLRVVSPKKDDLQLVIGHLRKINFPIELTFCNYR